MPFLFVVGAVFFVVVVFLIKHIF